MPLADQLRAVERDRDALLDRIEVIVAAAESESRGFKDEEQKEYSELKAQVDGIVLRHKTLAEALDLQKLRASRLPGQSPAEVLAAEPGRQAAPAAPPFKLLPGIGFTRYAMSIAAAKGNLLQALEISKRWRETSPEVEKIVRAAIAVGTTTDPAWAGSLVEYRVLADEFIGLLTPATIIGQLPLKRVPFNVRIPRATAGASAQWVGEGKAKPVSKAAFDTLTVPQNKLAVISVITEELARFSNPSAELLVRDLLIQAISTAMNLQFIDGSAGVAGIKPASITNGVAAAGPVNGTANAIRDAALQMLSGFLAANYPLGGLRWVMNPTLAVYIGGLRTAQDVPAFPEVAGGSLLGVPFVTSTQVPITAGPPVSSPLILLDSASILLADDGQVTVDMSREATVEMSDNPEGEAGTTVSLWQANCVGIRAERFVTWVKARANSVAMANINHSVV